MLLKYLLLFAGDTAILLAAGWSPLKIAAFQIISQASAFVGLYVGISISQTSSAAEEWILSIASGLFLYVALADVVCVIFTFYSCFNQALKQNNF